MKLYKSIWFGLLVVALMVGMAFAVAACGEEEPDTTTTAAAGETTTTAAAGEPTTTAPAETTTTAAAGGVKEGGTLVYEIGNPSFIEPTQAFESEGVEIVQAVFDSLVQFDYLTNELIPDVAESWEANADATVWTFRLKQGTTFHNGREVVAGDFKYAWERICNPVNESGISYHLATVQGYDEMQAGTATELSGVKVIDDYTLEVTLSYGYGDFEYVVGHPCLAPIPQEVVEADPDAYALQPIGNGPFMLSEPWAASQYVKVVKYPDYQGTQPHIDGIEFKIFEEIETAYLEYQAGTIDFTQIPPGNVEAAKAAYGVSDDGYTIQPGKQVLLGPELAIYYILLNNEAAPFDNPDVRRAFSLAINRQTICDVAYEGVRKPADNFVPPGVAGYQEGAWPYSKYDVEMAKEYLSKAGYPNGEGFPTIKLSFNSGAGHEDVMTLVQADLKAIGITAEFDTSDAPTYWDKAQNGNYQIGRSGWIADYPIIDNFVYSNLVSTSADNYARYKNLAFDDAITAARQISDTDARIAKYQEAVAIAGEDCPVVPITFYAHNRVGSMRVHDLIYSGMGLTDFVSCWLE